MEVSVILKYYTIVSFEVINALPHTSHIVVTKVEDLKLDNIYVHLPKFVL